MARRTQTPQTPPGGDPPTDPGPGPPSCPPPAAPGGTPLIAGRALVQTVRHFFPDLNAWLDRLPDRRDQEACTYPARFLAWWGLSLYWLQLGSRRQLDYDLRAGGPQVLTNFNRLAETDLTTLPVHGTLDHFLGHVRLAGGKRLRTQLVQRLLRMKARDAARLLGRPVLLIDATGLAWFPHRHCPHGLTQRLQNRIWYYHQVLKAKLLGPAGVVISLDSEFIENADAHGAAGRSAEAVKQDCELTALRRLAPRLKQRSPQRRFVLAVDSLSGCGPVFALAHELHWSVVATFKEGRTPALWREFQALRPRCPENMRRREWGAGLVQVFRWVTRLDYEDSAGRHWPLNALECTETSPGAASARYFAWVTDLPVSRRTVEEVAQKGGRYRWKVENEGFNRQKNSGLNLEHAYSLDPEKGKAYYLLLRLAFILVQLVERGSLLRRLAEELGRPVWLWFGSLKNVARRRLLESVRNAAWPEAWFDPHQAEQIRISLDSS